MSDTRDHDVVAGFGDEWSRFDQTSRDDDELRRVFDDYFRVFPWDEISPDSVGFDLGCGTGRWARFVSERVGHVVCVDASSEALSAARRHLAHRQNVHLVQASAGGLPFPPGGMDFAYSLGVLHHTTDPLDGLRDAVAKLKPGGVLLLYVYYALDERPRFFVAVWRGADAVRRVVSRLPLRARYVVSQVIAAVVYLPAARLARVAELMGVDVRHLPLSAYRSKSFYAMRTDALDRFGTRIERRFTSEEVVGLMSAAGLVDVTVGTDAPYWCAVGRARGVAGIA